MPERLPIMHYAWLPGAACLTFAIVALITHCTQPEQMYVEVAQRSSAQMSLRDAIQKKRWQLPGSPRIPHRSGATDPPMAFPDGGNQDIVIWPFMWRPLAFATVAAVTAGLMNWLLRHRPHEGPKMEFISILTVKGTKAPPPAKKAPSAANKPAKDKSRLKAEASPPTPPSPPINDAPPSKQHTVESTTKEAEGGALTPGKWRIYNVDVAASKDPGKDDFSIHDGLRAALRKRIGVDPPNVTLIRKSFDGRPTKRGREPKFSYVVDVDIDASLAMQSHLKLPMELAPSELPPPGPPAAPADMEQVVIVGAGPAGLFAALRFVEAGIGHKVVIVERGQPVEQRGRAIGALFHRRVLSEDSNVCFGEGGAGTWSDGKLTTRIGRNAAEVRKVLNLLHSFGAPDQVLVSGKPHMGTDNLVRLLRNARHHLEEGGVRFMFDSKVVDLQGGNDGQRVTGVVLANGQTVPCGYCLLATGHSSRGIYELLYNKGGDAALEAKGFAVGFRVEHPQELINRLQLGKWATSVESGKGPLPVADYRLACGEAEKTGGGDSYGDAPSKGVYSFCMCPGGQIVPTSIDPEELCVNGMSFSRRQSNWANSALVVTVGPSDWQHLCPPTVPKPLAGLWFQQQMERRAAEMGGGNLTVPVQRLVDFLKKQESDPATLPSSSYRLGVKAAPLHQLYPDHIYKALVKAVATEFERSLPGFASSPQALMHGVETRTSSPVRVLRDPETLQSAIPGLFPAGEGAGYSGGIVSSAVDGTKVADAILREASRQAAMAADDVQQHTAI